jgi:hypothetical protein
MILILRGHIRKSFENPALYNLIKKLYSEFPYLKLFIHTWNMFSNNLSWRTVETNNQNVNEEIIYEYFDDLKHLIEKIIIDDDTKIQLIGNLCGNINNGPCPIIGWKNCWYGKYRIINYLYNTHANHDETIVNCRFDILQFANFSETYFINFIKNNSEIKFTKNIFFLNGESWGCDNLYIGNINTMYKLSYSFFYELDNILSKNNDTIHQEFLVYRINNELFN